jgi:hypothetical protein
MNDKKDSYMTEDQWRDGREWHREFTYTPDLPYPFPIVPAGTHLKHDAVGHLSSDGRVHVFNTEIIEKLVRAGLRMRARVAGNGTKSDGGNGGHLRVDLFPEC